MNMNKFQIYLGMKSYNFEYIEGIFVSKKCS